MQGCIEETDGTTVSSADVAVEVVIISTWSSIPVFTDVESLIWRYRRLRRWWFVHIVWLKGSATGCR
jgi:hypothetical protein